jgi:hypothetical protein
LEGRQAAVTPIQRSCSYQGGYGGDETNWKVKAKWNNPVVPQPATAFVLLKYFLFVTLFFVGGLQGGGRGSSVRLSLSNLRVWETSAENVENGENGIERGEVTAMEWFRLEAFLLSTFPKETLAARTEAATDCRDANTGV